MSSTTDRYRRNLILDRFCGPKMTYDPINDFWAFDARLFNDQDKFIGIAKIFSKAGNFASTPIVEISKTELDLIYQIGLLTHKKPAVVIKFRNKLTYLRLEHVNYSTGDTRKGEVYKIPVGELKLCQ